MRIVITGASELVGSALVPYLSKRGHSVSPMVRSVEPLGENIIRWDLSGALLIIRIWMRLMW